MTSKDAWSEATDPYCLLHGLGHWTNDCKDLTGGLFDLIGAKNE